jgi:drug/metabolite transporter (DMT)-like permease
MASLCLVALALAMGGPGTWNGAALASLGYVGLVAGPIGTWCYLLTMVHLPVVVASVGFLMTPAVGLLLSTWWLGEPLGADLLLGSAMIIGGVAVSVIPARRA